MAAVLPSSRSVVTGTPATAFATIINTGNVAATQCGIALPPGSPALFGYQTTDPATNVPIGAADTPVDIAAGGLQSFVLAVTPTTGLTAAELPLVFDCASTDPAPVFSGVNTLTLTAETVPTPDIIAVTSTLSQDGVVRVAVGETTRFAAAAINNGPAATLTATIDDNGASLPLAATLCQSDPATGACLRDASPAANVTLTIGTGDAATFTAFVAPTADIPFDPAANRLALRFITADGIVRGGTSVAVMTTAAPDQHASAE